MEKTTSQLQQIVSSGGDLIIEKGVRTTYQPQ